MFDVVIQEQNSWFSFKFFISKFIDFRKLFFQKK